MGETCLRCGACLVSKFCLLDVEPIGSDSAEDDLSVESSRNWNTLVLEHSARQL